MELSLFSGYQTIAYSSVSAVLKINVKRLEKLREEEEEDLEKLFALNVVMNTIESTNERSVWRHPTSSHWWDHIYPNLTDELFVCHFRVDRFIFNWLVEQVRDHMTTKDTTFRNAISVERKVAVSLKCLATTCDMLTVAALFGIGKSSAHKYFLQFINCLYAKIVHNIIKFPNQEEMRDIAQEFEKLWGFPMAVGAIDGTHIPFNPPTHLVTDFHNYKGWNSILAIAMCDAHGKALWLKCGMPGRQSDSGAFKSTECYAKLASGEILPSGTKQILGQQIPFMILGDSGFAMESWLIKPFTHHGLMTEKQKMFNYRHSRARRSVENMFGRIKLRWRRLLRGLDVKYETAHKVVSVAFALHNLCETQSVEYNSSVDELNENNE